MRQNLPETRAGTVFVAAGISLMLCLMLGGTTATLAATEASDPGRRAVSPSMAQSSPSVHDWLIALADPEVSLEYGSKVWSDGELMVLEDNISDGRALDMSALGGFEGLARSPVHNGLVAASHDLGHSYVRAWRDRSGNRWLAIAVERLDASLGMDDSYIDFELNQGHIQAVSVSWPLRGERRAGDLLVRMSLVGGNIVSVRLHRWDGHRFTAIDAGRGIGAVDCSSVEPVFSYCDAPLEAKLLAPNRELYDPFGYPVAVPEPRRLIQLSINIGALLEEQAEIATVQVRTPEDLSLGTFRSIGTAHSQPSPPATGRGQMTRIDHDNQRGDRWQRSDLEQ